MNTLMGAVRRQPKLCVAGIGVRCESEVTREVNRVMTNPEINGNPVLLDFSKGESTTGFSKEYVSGYNRIFGKAKKKTLPTASESQNSSNVHNE